MRTIKELRRRTGVALTAFILVGGALLFAPQAASAQTCINEVWQAHGNTNNLTCTANDVTLADATNIQISSGGSCDAATGVCRCNAGQLVTFTADFRMDLGAQTRYDVGFYIATDNDPNQDGALTGQCTATASLLSNTTRPNNFINLDTDQAGDVCGDITGPLGTAHNPLFVTATITAQCPSTPGQQLQLPFATTWRQPGSNDVCGGTGTMPSNNDVFPGSPSKCNKGVLTLDIFADPVRISVTKATTTASVAETGGQADYVVTVKNEALVLPMTLTSLVDVPFGDITHVGGAILATTCQADGVTATCEIGGVIAPGNECTCTFTAVIPPGDFPGSVTDVVEGCGTNEFSTTPICDTGSAEVPYRDVEQPPVLTKIASGAACQIDVTYSVGVTNQSDQDTLTLKTLTDVPYGDITSVHDNVISTTCGQAVAGAGPLPFVIPVNGTYSCQFVGRINNCESLRDVVTGTATDDDGANYSPSDDALVEVSVQRPL